MSISKSLILNKIKEHYKFVSDAEFARFLEITPQNLKHWYARNTFNVHNLVIKCIDINPQWITTGEGEMLKNLTSNVINYEKKGVPYYDVDFTCGFDVVLNDQTVNPNYYIDFMQYNNADCWINASGDSMRPTINPGDILAVRQIPLLDWDRHVMYGEIYAIVTDINRTVKKIRKSKLGEHYIKLIPENLSEYDEQDMLKKDVKGIFQVLGCMKRLL